MISPLRLITLICLLATIALQAEDVELTETEIDSKVTLTQIEIEHLKEKVDLMKQKVSILEAQKRELSANLGVVEENPNLKERMQGLISQIAESAKEIPILEYF